MHIKARNGIKDLSLNRIYIIKNREGEQFSSKLVGIEGSKLIFESRAGVMSIHDLDDVLRMVEVRKHERAIE